MNKNALMKKISEISAEEVNQKQVASVLSALEAVVRQVLTENGTVIVPGICKVKPKTVKERTRTIMMGPMKGETYTIPEHKEGSVKAVTSLKRVFR